MWQGAGKENGIDELCQSNVCQKNTDIINHNRPVWCVRYCLIISFLSVTPPYPCICFKQSGFHRLADTFQSKYQGVMGPRIVVLKRIPPSVTVLQHDTFYNICYNKGQSRARLTALMITGSSVASEDIVVSLISFGKHVTPHQLLLAVIWRDFVSSAAAGHGLGWNWTVGMEWEGEHTELLLLIMDSGNTS